MPKHPKIVPITGRKLKSNEVPTHRNASCVQISFSELLLRYLQHQQTQETAQAETRARKPAKIVYLPKRRSDDSCNT